jgi:hypothetical protein
MCRILPGLMDCSAVGRDNTMKVTKAMNQIVRLQCLKRMNFMSLRDVNHWGWLLMMSSS